MEFINKLQWDSDFFGIEIGIVTISKDALNPKILKQVINKAKQKGLRCIYVQCAANKPEVNEFCAKNGFILVDFKTALIKNVPKTAEKFDCSMIAMAKPKEYYPALENIADVISLSSRYACDLNFGVKASQRLYREWVRRSYQDNYCEYFIMYMKDDQPVGLLTLKKKEGEYAINLLGTLESVQNSGIGSNLVKYAEKIVAGNGLDKLYVVTQGYNVAAMRFYQKHGFMITDVSVYYHLWI